MEVEGDEDVDRGERAAHVAAVRGVDHLDDLSPDIDGDLPETLDGFQTSLQKLWMVGNLFSSISEKRKKSKQFEYIRK
jgi:hypothetical protein